jgi:RNA polymerase sigma-70 factor (ECF subfamily)
LKLNAAAAVAGGLEQEMALPVMLPALASVPARPVVEMKADEFTTRYARPLAALWQSVTERYGVSHSEFYERVQHVVVRTQGKDTKDMATGDATELIAGLRAGELCVAIACEKGENAAWLHFEREYKHGMHLAARALTKDDAEADDLTQFVFGELYGLRFDGDRRMSKLQHYSGRGSLGGWLRAVIYQAFIDRKRQTARFEQVEEVAEFDRLAANSHEVLNGLNGHHVALHAPIVQPDDIEDTRLRRASEEAMGMAFAALEAKDRLMLNYYFFDNLTLREIGLMMNVHEATISRWLAKAQKQVRKKTEEILQRTYGLRRAEVAECLALAARSEIDVRKLLSEATAAVVERAP